MDLLHPQKAAALWLGAALLAPAAWATPLLHCDVTYAGSTHVIEAAPVADPYPVASVEIAGRFRFKAVMLGQGDRVDYVKLYAYLDARKQPILLHQATYLPPFRPDQAPGGLTGEQRIYGGPMERELIYACSLTGVKP